MNLLFYFPKMKQNSLNFGFQARYFQLGELNSTTKNLIFVLHGHGQLGKYFIRKFQVLDTGDNCIIAPEGLSRYYLEGYTGRVGATWMTKEDRLTDIANYQNYLNTLFTNVTSSLSKDTSVTIIGFSQGAATASRWAATPDMDFDQLVLWAGIFPPDMDFEHSGEKFKQKNIKYIYGIQDPFITPERFNEMRNLSQRLKVDPEVITFQGAHEIDTATLEKLFETGRYLNGLILI